MSEHNHALTPDEVLEKYRVEREKRLRADGTAQYTELTDAYAEFDRPLGPPKADAKWQGLTATREFAHASVWVDLSTKQARIDWH